MDLVCIWLSAISGFYIKSFRMKLFIISNRLPVKARKTDDGQLEFIRSEGGLATGLGSLNMSVEMHWIGWPGIYLKDDTERKKVSEHLESLNYHPVFLTEEQILNYYEGYSNSILWPLCHYFYAFVKYESKYWEAYKEVNKIFGQVAEMLIEPGDMVWIHDYHLMLLPKIIQDKNLGVGIGYFHHIPFPSYELFRVLPERAEILNGLLGADLVGFHTQDYMRHFISAVERVMNLQFKLDHVLIGKRSVSTDAFPMGINYHLYYNAILNSEVREKAEILQKNFGHHKLMLSVDRLDYSKGILHRIKGFAQFLQHYPAYREKISLVMIVVPSRDKVDRYADLKKKVDETISSVNGSYSTIHWTPIYYFYRSFEFEELAAMYYIADIALVTPLRDGMNLVAKEYVAVKRDKPGVLILSEMAGAATELNDAIVINPNNVDKIEFAILDAMEMSLEEQYMDMAKMQKVISKQTVKKWAQSFVNELERIKLKNFENDKKQVDLSLTEKIGIDYKKAQKRLIILDYDGTLSPFQDKPEDASPTVEMLAVLNELCEDLKNQVVISSGRDFHTLESWLGHLPLDMTAEHGAFYKEEGEWHKKSSNITWNEEILQIFQNYVDKTPRSEIEIKDTALVWHYRKVDAWFASLREQQLVNDLIGPCARLHLQIMRGNKIVEIKSPEYTKGAEAKRLLQNKTYDFILAIGDDATDEDTFMVLPRTSYTIKVGPGSSVAKHYLLSQQETLPFIRSVMKESGPDEF
jgi:trehalose 6-phosphate synthase/phosphatase